MIFKKSKINNGYILICIVRTGLDTQVTTNHLFKNSYFEHSNLY